jgi:hypothetical protein
MVETILKSLAAWVAARLCLFSGEAMKPITSLTLVGFLLLGLASSSLAGMNEWTYVGLYPEVITDIVVDPRDSQIVYATACKIWYDSNRNGGVFKTTDHGLTWDTLGFRNSYVLDVELDPLHPDTMWVVCNLEGPYRSTDGGQTWASRRAGMSLGGADELGTTKIEVSHFDSNLMLCIVISDFSLVGRLYRSTNGGELWSVVPFPPPYPPFTKVCFDSLVPGRVWALNPWMSTLWASNDSGVSFQEVTAEQDPAYIDDLALDPFRPNRLWAVGAGAPGTTYTLLLQTVDACSTWQQPDTLPDGFRWGYSCVRPSRTRQNTVWLADQLRVYLSTDSGATEHPISNGWPEGDPFIYVLSIVAEPCMEVWAGTDDRGILAYTVTDTMSVVGATHEGGAGIGVEVFPNPAPGMLNINMPPHAELATFLLYNVLGQEVMSQALGSAQGRQVVRLPAGLPSGRYFVRISAEGRPAGSARAIPIVITK